MDPEWQGDQATPRPRVVAGGQGEQGRIWRSSSGVEKWGKICSGIRGDKQDPEWWKAGRGEWSQMVTSILPPAPVSFTMGILLVCK